ncbi:Obg family GTPase CgtA [Candidatus Blochmannia ocreatus (nom. nud.)]|uniref:Obg family GTPase CgtA n=1 Tax=Candidatus Blochmannia ocreatus (nom. nud.) TaxID=251538 RepID=A0ABY4SW54_9ENTR|nr:Obg family GTPase CgtA [Candidatus Blochmannia ocreatus]URJ25180.1 Obg family GTPase CgtA [Candidatus Blochmannia ocreatus]
MKFIDMTDITVIAGDGGNGYISVKKTGKKFPFLKKLYSSNGGDGGNVWLLADSNMNNLSYFCFKNVFKAGNGHGGSKNGCSGSRGKDIIIKVPWGTKVICRQTNKLLGEMGQHQQRLMVAKGGMHGSGHIKRRHISYHTTSNSIMDGEKGESHNLLLELRLIADVGVFGLPNSGKSSFLHVVSSAKPKVANYPFTTLVPNLGVVKVNDYNRFVVADIPGIIKGASDGSGLGIRFLKHLEHCHILLHFVDIAPSDNSNPLDNIITIQNELNNYKNGLLYKPCWLIFNKIDLLASYLVKKKITYIINTLKWKERYYYISSVYKTNVSELCNAIMKFIMYRS